MGKSHRCLLSSGKNMKLSEYVQYFFFVFVLWTHKLPKLLVYRRQARKPLRVLLNL